MTLGPRNPKEASVLVVEDNHNDAMITLRALKTFGIRNIAHAETAEDAVRFLGSERCDVALVDFNLPGMNGLRFLAKVRQLDSPPIVIFVTGARDEKVAVEALKGGAADYLTKDELLTAGVVNSLQNALRGQDRADIAERGELLGRNEDATCEVALAESEWIVSSAGAHLPDVGRLSTIGSEDLTAVDARDAFLRYLKASMSGDPFCTEEEGLIRLLTERGSSPREIVLLFRAAVRALQVDGDAAGRPVAIRPGACLSRVLIGLVAAYQDELSARTFARTAA
jgi:CheY-like chemotaxis protein